LARSLRRCSQLNAAEARLRLGKSPDLTFVNHKRPSLERPGQSLNDFVALLIAVAAFLFAMLVGQALLSFVLSAWGWNDTVLAFGPALRILVSAAIGVFAYRKLLHTDVA
jgi:hypothetical protein